MTEQNNDPGEDFDEFEDDTPDDSDEDEDDANPFGESDDDAGDDDGDSPWLMPPEPVGILRGYTEAKEWSRDGQKKLIVSVHITDPEFKGAEPLETWLDTASVKDMQFLLRFASALGVPITKAGRTVKWPGGSPMTALHERAGRFMVSSWDKNDGSSVPQVAKWLPKAGASLAWDAHMEDLAARGESYTDAQLAILKKCPGVVPEDF